MRTVVSLVVLDEDTTVVLAGLAGAKAVGDLVEGDELLVSARVLGLRPTAIAGEVGREVVVAVEGLARMELR